MVDGYSNRQTHDMKLYFMGNRSAMGPHIALELTGTEYEAEKVDPSSDSFKGIAPRGQVPVLELDSGECLTQNNAILEYIARTYPGAKLFGKTETDQMRVEEWLAYLAADFHMSFAPALLPQLFTTSDDESDTQRVTDAGMTRVKAEMQYLGDHLSEAGYLVGDQVTVADCYAFAIARWYDEKGLGNTAEEFPAVAAYLERMRALDAVATVEAVHNKA